MLEVNRYFIVATATGGSLVIDWESLTAKFRPPGEDNGKNGGAATQAVGEGGNGVISSRKEERLQEGKTGV